MATTNPSSGIITDNSEFVNLLNHLSLGGIDRTMCTEPDNDKPWRGWRYLPNVDSDVMIVSSYGHVYPQHVKIAEKLAPSDCTTDRLVLAREELDCLLDLYKQADSCHLAYCYPDHGGLQMSKDYYLQRMKKLLMESEKELVYLFYTGNSEEGTGNWCLKDGVITFQDIYDMYIECFKGKRLTIISDCSYSGNWVKECAKVYDNQGILFCGHHSREKGILLNCHGSCKSYQQATILAFVKEAMQIIVDEVLFTNKQLSTGQQGFFGDFKMIRCNNQPNEQCEYNTSNRTWMNKLCIRPLVYIVRGEDRGRPAWHYVLVDEDKVQQFNDIIRSGRIDVRDYGKILYSGCGKDPPQDIKDKIDVQFGYV